MAEASRSGPLESLEKELSCSICTDVLYQPLTLLDCLHTFCGACLKEWFSWQAQSANSLHPYTCPSCRASVRATQPNATVTTLLDMFLQSNPSRGKTERERDDMRKIYKPGDNVMPRLRPRQDSSDEEDRRLMDQVRMLSLEEAGVGGSNTLSPAPDRRRRLRSHEHSREHSRERRRRERDGSRSAQVGSGLASPQSPPPPRHVEHQSSLRSLLSASDIDTQEMEDEIMRQIREEGLLDGIDLDNIDGSQEEEITERIAEAFRRRQRDRDRARARHHRSRSVTPSNSAAGSAVHHSEGEERPQRRPRPRAESAATREAMAERNSSQSQASRPPASRPHLFDAVNQGSRHHRRSSSQGDRSSSRRNNHRQLSSVEATAQRPAARSATDLSNRPQTIQGSTGVERRRRPSHDDRRATDPQGGHTFVIPNRSHEPSPRRAGFLPDATRPHLSPAQAASPHAPPRRMSDLGAAARPARPSNNSSTSLSRARNSAEIPRSDARPSSSDASARRSTLYSEPYICCARCRSEVQYDLHFTCDRCLDREGAKYCLCLRCYRSGVGCLHWFGFGSAARTRYEQKAPPGGYPPGYEQPHILSGQRYRRPLRPAWGEAHARLTDEDPSKRLESGVFCDVCHAFANGCYWKCDTCNDGAWGFCNDCVNQGRHCTHPLLPLHHGQSASFSTRNSTSPSTTTNPPAITPKSASLIRGPGTVPLANKLFRPLTFSTDCDCCTYPIPPSHTRFHCPRCYAGNNDICNSCYHALVTSGAISFDNGPNGWRRCPRGHRMVVVGFEDRDAGQRRIVTKDLVGGLALRDDETPALAPTPPQPTAFPPDGGVGLRAVALWSYYPAPDVRDELTFPKGAEIREAEDINGDWFWGVYAGAKGLFPGAYVRVL
ncbi:hypothetical protein IWZ00DRAFT_435883 [Phyllosticta capitalensis]